VNEIRHAFEDYIKVVQHTESSLGTYESEIKLRSPERHSERGVNKIDDLTSVADDSQHSESETSVAVSLWKNPSESLELSRRKNVHAAQSKMKSELFSNNYDEEYDNEEDEKINSKANSGLKVHETREIPVHSLTDYKLTALATNKNIKKVFKQEFYGQQEIYNNYDQGI
ncbi:CLUMA_CG020906, isoform A, partial [Clunio marinus]